MFQVFNQRLAGYLMYNGLKLISIEPNPDIVKYNVFTFEKSDNLYRLLNDYQAAKSKSKSK